MFDGGETGWDPYFTFCGVTALVMGAVFLGLAWWMP